jgi:hypothetical protein
MRTLIAVALLVVGTSAVALAGGPVPVPEIDATTAMSAAAVLAGAVLVIRARRKR